MSLRVLDHEDVQLCMDSRTVRLVGTDGAAAAPNVYATVAPGQAAHRPATPAANRARPDRSRNAATPVPTRPAPRRPRRWAPPRGSRARSTLPDEATPTPRTQQDPRVARPQDPSERHAPPTPPEPYNQYASRPRKGWAITPLRSASKPHPTNSSTATQQVEPPVWRSPTSLRPTRQRLPDPGPESLPTAAVAGVAGVAIRLLTAGSVGEARISS